MSRLFVALALLLWSFLLAGGWYWIASLERNELLVESDVATLNAHAKGPDATRVSARLLRVELHAGERATFEVCFVDPPSQAELLGAFDVAVFGLTPMRLLLRVPLDQAHLDLIKRSEEAACLPLGGGVIEHGGEHSLDLVWPERPPSERVRAMQLWARTWVRRDLHAPSWFVVMSVGMLVLSLFGWLSRGQQAAPPLEGRGWGASTLAAMLLLVGVYLMLQVPTVGSSWGYVKGVMVASLQVAMVFAAARWVERSRKPLAQLALRFPSRAWASGLLAVCGGVVLSLAARVALQLVPSTGVAPIETFIAWPSGTLALAMVGALAPFAEEIFFRGYLYGVFRRWGEIHALALSTLAFTGFHLAQSWGNWGGVVAVGIAGIGFGFARYWSGSVWIAALAHTAYNLALSVSSFFSVSLW